MRQAASMGVGPVVDGHEHAVKLGACLSNTKSRRAKVTADKLQALADLGLEWATV
jgi:hypothetical protein